MNPRVWAEFDHSLAKKYKYFPKNFERSADFQLVEQIYGIFIFLCFTFKAFWMISMNMCYSCVH